SCGFRPRPGGTEAAIRPNYPPRQTAGTCSGSEIHHSTSSRGCCTAPFTCRARRRITIRSATSTTCGNGLAPKLLCPQSPKETAMIRIALVILAVATCCAWKVSAQKANASDEVRAAIKQTALDYIEGWYEGDAERMERAVHPELAKR